MDLSKQNDSIPFFHQLMTEEVKQTNDYLNQWNSQYKKLENDFLSKRHNALNTLCLLKQQEAASKEDKTIVQSTETEVSSKDKLWSGAPPLEKALISCCTMGDMETNADGEAINDVEEDTWVIGALRETKILEFVGLVTLHCQDLASRSLVLAILERTHQLDEKIMENFEMTKQALASQHRYATGALAERDKPSPSKKRPRLSEGDREEVVPSSRIIVNPKPPPPQRLMTFLRTKGLEILSRWLMEASDAVVLDVPGNGRAEERTQIRPSPTGLLLLPMLEFLENIPFSKTVIVQSKINKTIKKLSKNVDSLVVSREQAEGRGRLDTWTHPDTGGLPVLAVQTALNNIKLSWERKAKESSKRNQSTSTVKDPLEQSNALLKDRLDDLKKMNSGDTNIPTWLVCVEKEEGKNVPTPEASNSQLYLRTVTVEEKARKERENERHHLLKKDLEMARQEKLKLLKKLREMKKPNETVECAQSTSRRGVKWKDGLPASSKQRKRDVLEDVFVFDRKHTKLVRFKNDVANQDDES